jgi:prepilin-type N-terminal cleavage/methylation domain
MDRYPASKGFSLIELIVVVAIVSVLLMVAYPRYQASVDRAETTALLSNIQQLRIALDRYYEDKGRYPDSLQRLVDDRYLRALPVDPVTGRSDTWILVTANAEQGSGIVDVRSGAPGSNAGGVPYRDLEP